MYSKTELTENRLKAVQCGNCKFFTADKEYKYEGVCSKDNEVVRIHRVCNKLPTDYDRRSAKIKKSYKPY